MMRMLTILIMAGAIALASVAPAEARIFTPQAHWSTSGQVCVATRKPPARRWRVLPPRTCAEAEMIVINAVVAFEPLAPVSLNQRADAPVLAALQPTPPLDWRGSPA
jgi:hypothetical protein